jgi:transcription elongation GreA/GreB family factor
MSYDEVPPPTLFLQFDLDALDAEINVARDEIRRVKLEANESNEQSSESWHDNYTFEESQRQLKMLLNLLGGLSKARERSQVVTPKANPNVTDIGTTVTFVDNDKKFSDEISIGSYMVSKKLMDLDFVSYESPLGALLLGSTVGDTRVGKVGNRELNVTITGISDASRKIPSAVAD